MIRVSNKKCRSYVNSKQEFTANNLYALWYRLTRYAVYSYRDSFLIFVYDAQADMWFGNSTKYSASTSRHISQARPEADVTWVPSDTMDYILLDGAAACVEHELREAAGI